MQRRHPLLAQAFALSEAGRNAEAVLLVNQVAALGDAEAIFTLAEMKWRGGMVPQDPAQARDLYRRAGELGHGRAAATYTNLLANGVAGERNWPMALRRLAKEARTDPRRRAALHLLERMNLDENGDPTSPAERQRLSDSPSVDLLPRLFSSGECDYLLKLAEPGYAPSMVYDAQRRLVRDPIRTSDASTIHWQIEDPAVHALNRRLAAATGTGAEQGEALQILRYRPGQQYRSHFDFVQRSDNQRSRTALVYLNDDYEGGETCFVKADLKVKGRKGDALLFVNALPDGNVDPMSQHAGLPVERGTKLLASRWIRDHKWTP
jgi:prolyl 4-hydroxylase